MRWWNYRVLLPLVALGLLLLGIGLCIGHVLSMRSINRAAYLGYYCGTLNTYLTVAEGRPVPDSIEQFVNAYNSLEGREEFPSTAGFSLPELRPIRELGEGPFLVLIESPPPKWYDFGRWVIYTDPNYRQVDMRRVSAKELLRLRAKDDEARRRASKRDKSNIGRSGSLE